jgi:hypothetical protein
LIKIVGCDKRFSLQDVCLCVYTLHEEPPEAGNDIRDHKHNDDQPEYLIGIHEYVLSLDPIGPCRLVEIRFDKSLYPTRVEELDHLGQSCHPNKSSVNATIEYPVKGKCGYEVQEHPS